MFIFIANLINKMDKKLLKILNGSITTLNKFEAEKLFEFCFNELFNDKHNSTHGFKLFICLLAKPVQAMYLKNLAKYQEQLNNNKHRHQRALIALWALGQPGYFNLLNGIKSQFHLILLLFMKKFKTFFF